MGHAPLVAAVSARPAEKGPAEKGPAEKGPAEKGPAAKGPAEKGGLVTARGRKQASLWFSETLRSKGDFSESPEIAPASMRRAEGGLVRVRRRRRQGAGRRLRRLGRGPD